MKKIISLLLCMLMLIPMLASCGSGSSGGGKAVLDQAEDSVVPNDVKFEGEVFNILCREDNSYGTYKYEIVADEGSTDTVNQAVYQRNRDVCDIYGLSSINAITVPGDWEHKDEFINTFRNSIDANLKEFDLIVSAAAYMSEAQLSQYYYDYNKVPYIKDNLDAKYYFQDAVKELTINGQLKYLIGDYSLTYWDHLYVMYFNKQTAQEYALDDIYSLVKEGKWTIDKCLEMASGKWKDSNANEWPDELDSFGYISEIPNTVDALHAHFDIPRTKNVNGEVIVDMDVGKMTSILEKMVDFKKTDDCYMTYSTSNVVEDELPLNKIFMEGRALFYPSYLRDASKFRSMNMDFGIVPYPKWDENQERYLTLSNLGYSVACVPVDARNFEMTGAVLETLSQKSYNDVIPAYYDKALKFKLTRDEASAEMLDIIRDGLVINFGDFFGYAINTDKIIRELIRHENTNFSSFYASNQKGYVRKIEALLKEFE